MKETWVITGKCRRPGYDFRCVVTAPKGDAIGYVQDKLLKKQGFKIYGHDGFLYADIHPRTQDELLYRTSPVTIFIKVEKVGEDGFCHKE